MELEPQLRDIIFKFYESKYASCLKLLDEIKVRFYGTPVIHLKSKKTLLKKSSTYCENYVNVICVKNYSTQMGFSFDKV